MNKTIKSKIKTNNNNKKIQTVYWESQIWSDFLFIETLITEVTDLITCTKDLYYKNHAKRLNNPLSPAKTYWSVLKTFYNDKKTQIIPPLLIDDRFVTDI